MQDFNSAHIHYRHGVRMQKMDQRRAQGCADARQLDISGQQRREFAVVRLNQAAAKALRVQTFVPFELHEV